MDHGANADAIIDHLVRWTRNKALDEQQHGFVVGISGGVDSAVVSTLCARTDLPTLCLSMPIRQAKDQVERANAHAKWLQHHYANVTVVELDLTQHFEQLGKLLKPFAKGDDALASVNTRSRLRLTALYYYATVNSYFVVGTGNKVEQDGVGFFAKYGDGGMDISPIGELFKSEVCMVAEALGIDRAILDAPPTDGLWDDGRTDLDQIGATYPELEWAMDLRMGGVDTRALDLTAREREVLAIYDQRHSSNRHKMKPAPRAPVPQSFRS